MIPYHEILCILQSHRLASFVEACIDLGVFDRLAGGPLTLDELSRDTETHRRALHRCARAFAHFGLLDLDANDVVSLTEVSRPLTAESEFSIRPWHKLHRLLKPEAPGAGEDIKDMLRTGKSLFQIKHGCIFYEYLKKNPDISTIFHQAMESASQIEVRDILAGFDFSASNHITEIAGGTGALISGVLRQHVTLEGQLFDQPDVVAALPPTPRLTVAGVDMHVSLPDIPGDAMMKRIMHSYSDDKASTILGNIGRGMSSGRKLYIFELVDDSAAPNPYIGMKHLQMLNVHGAPGKSGGPGERTRAEFQSVLDAAGFELVETQHLGAIDAVIAVRR